jgi:hypothetical protein
MFRLALGPTQPPNQWALPMQEGIKWPGHENNHPPPSTVPRLMMWSHTPTAPYVCMAETLPFTLQILHQTYIPPTFCNSVLYTNTSFNSAGWYSSRKSVLIWEVLIADMSSIFMSFPSPFRQIKGQHSLILSA